MGEALFFGGPWLKTMGLNICPKDPEQKRNSTQASHMIYMIYIIYDIYIILLQTIRVVHVLMGAKPRPQAMYSGEVVLLGCGHERFFR